MKIIISHSMIKPISKDKVSFMFYFYHGVCSDNYFQYDTFYKSFDLRFCWNLLALTIIYTNGK